MFNLFSKKSQVEPQQVQVDTIVGEMPTKTKYPTIVDEIHNEFFTAGENILAEATCLLKELETKDLAKGKRLAALGFGKTREAQVSIETEKKLATTKEIADLVMYYRINYPNNKFITEEQVKQICEKYGLVLGETDAYKGFVPNDKLKLIENFKINRKDVLIDVYSVNTWGSDKGRILNDNGKSATNYSAIYKIGKSPAKLKICAPLKDMEVGQWQQISGYKIQDIPDPVVLQPVKGGYLIICAWGDEASDEIVVNQAFN